MEDDSWWITRRGRGLYTRTTALPLTSRFYVLAVLIQAAVLIGVNTAIAVLVQDCLSTLVLGLANLTTVFMSYFAIEAIRTENRHQLAAYAITSVVFLSNYVPPIIGSTDGPMHVHMKRLQVEDDVRLLLLVALVVACSLQLISLLLAIFSYKLTYCTGAVPTVGMRTYKKVGTDPTLLACYFVYQGFCTMLKVDWLFQIQLLAYCILGLPEGTWQWQVSLAAHCPVACAWLPLGLLAARRESAVMMLVLVVAATCQVPLYAAQLLSLPPPNATFHNHSHAHNHSHHHVDDRFGVGSDADGSLSWLPSLTRDRATDAAWDADGGLDIGAAAREDHYCTERLRDHTFPFGSPALNLLYLLALLSRLLLLFSGLRVRNNFGRGLLSRVHKSRCSSDALASSIASNAMHHSATGSDVSERLMDSHGHLSGGALDHGHEADAAHVAADSYISVDGLTASRLDLISAARHGLPATSSHRGDVVGGNAHDARANDACGAGHDEGLLSRLGSDAASSEYSVAGGPACRLSLGPGSMTSAAGGSFADHGS